MGGECALPGRKSMQQKRPVHLISRRGFVRAGLALGLAAGLAPAAGEVFAAESAVLIVYYSRTGNTRAVAEMIREATGGDLVELRTVKPYPADYDAVVDVAKKELRAKARPAISTDIPDMARYRTVFVGYPCWWGTMPMAFFTFLEKYDLSGKVVVPFTTHGGSGFGDSLSDLKKLCPRSRILKGLAVPGNQARGAKSSVESWLQSLVF